MACSSSSASSSSEELSRARACLRLPFRLVFGAAASPAVGGGCAGADSAADSGSGADLAGRSCAETAADESCTDSYSSDPAKMCLIRSGEVWCGSDGLSWSTEGRLCSERGGGDMAYNCLHSSLLAWAESAIGICVACSSRDSKPYIRQQAADLNLHSCVHANSDMGSPRLRWAKYAERCSHYL